MVTTITGAFFCVALYLGGSGGMEFHIVRSGETFAQCRAAARLAETEVLPFNEESPITSDCFSLGG